MDSATHNKSKTPKKYIKHTKDKKAFAKANFWPIRWAIKSIQTLLIPGRSSMQNYLRAIKRLWLVEFEGNEPWLNVICVRSYNNIQKEKVEIIIAHLLVKGLGIFANTQEKLLPSPPTAICSSWSF